MSCPHLREMVVLYCQAYPVKKPVPLDRVVSTEPCVGHDFAACPVFQDVVARMRACAGPVVAASGTREPTSSDNQPSSQPARPASRR